MNNIKLRSQPINLGAEGGMRAKFRSLQKSEKPISEVFSLFLRQGDQLGGFDW